MKNTIKRIILMILMAGLGSMAFAMETNNNQPWYRRLVSSLASHVSSVLVRPEQETYDALPQEDAQAQQARIDAENRERAAREAVIAAEDAADARRDARNNASFNAELERQENQARVIREAELVAQERRAEDAEMEAHINSLNDVAQAPVVNNMPLPMQAPEVTRPESYPQRLARYRANIMGASRGIFERVREYAQTTYASLGTNNNNNQEQAPGQAQDQAPEATIYGMRKSHLMYALGALILAGLWDYLTPVQAAPNTSPSTGNAQTAALAQQARTIATTPKVSYSAYLQKLKAEGRLNEFRKMRVAGSCKRHKKNHRNVA